MPDSPKCIKCLKAGKIGQTYKIAGRGLYRCHDCKYMYHTAEFEPIEFAWKDDERSWKSWAITQGVKIAS